MKRAEIAAIGRIARRTARRSWKRTTLIVAIIAIPVAAAQVAAALMAASQITNEEYATQTLGRADVLLQSYAPTEESVRWVEEQLAELTPGATVLPYRNAYGSIPDAADYVEITDLDIKAPLAMGKLALVDGEAPDRAGEIALSDGLMKLTGAAIDDEVVLAVDGVEGPRRSYKVVGTVRNVLWVDSRAAVISPSDMDEVFGGGVNTFEFASRDASWLVASDDPDRLAQQVQQRWLTARAEFRPAPAIPKPQVLALMDDDLYASLSAEQITELMDYAGLLDAGDFRYEEKLYNEAWRMLDGAAPAYPELQTNTASTYLGWQSATDAVLQAPAVTGTVVAALLMAEVALVAGAAYATGIRRRLRELGLLTVNGATTQHMRWIVVGEGLLAGIVGAALGSAIAFGVVLGGRSTAQNFVDRYIVGMPLGVLELLAPALVGVAAATIAAWIPARAAVRVPATTALEGRMPLSDPRRWVVPAGVGVTVFGAFLLVVAKTAFGSTGAFQAGLGVALMIAGFALMSGPMVAWLGRRADRFPALARLVIRDSARQRTRAATAIAATMVVLVAPVAAGASLATSQAHDLNHGLSENPAHVLVAGESAYNVPPTASADPADIAAVAEIIPTAEHVTFEVYTDAGGTIVSPSGDAVVGSPHDEPQAGGWMVMAKGDRDLLTLLGVGEAVPSLESGKPIVLGIENRTIDVRIGDRILEAVEVPAKVMRFNFPRILIGEELAAELDPGESYTLALFNNGRPLTDLERLTIGEMATARPSWAEPLSPTQLLWLVGGATLLVVMLIIGLVTAVSATESDHDLRSMVAVGAPPRIRRRFLGIQTAYYTVFAGLLAVPLAILLLNVASTDTVTIGPFGATAGTNVVTPWAMIGIVLIGMPIVVGAVTALAVRSSPTVPPYRMG